MTRKILRSISAAAILAAVAAFGHPPSEIKLNYDATSRTLQATVLHDTKKTDEHFIEIIQVRINGKDMVKQSFLKQTDSQKRTVLFLLEDVKTNDQISVTGVCNVFGKKTETLKL